MTTLKGITLWNPFAFAMVAPAQDTGEPLKTVETRSWPTNYRGPIAIHAAQEKSSVRAAHLIGQDLRSAYVSAMGRNRDHPAFRASGVACWEDLAFGMILGVGQLVACVPTCPIITDTARRMIKVLGEEQWESERNWGNFSPGRWLWHVQEMSAFPTPIPYRGSQGLYDVIGVTV